MPVNIFNSFNDPSALVGTTQAYGVNDADQIVGYYQDGAGNHGYLLSGGVFTTLNDPSASGSNGTIAFGINASGFIVGGYGVGSITAHGFLYNPNNGTYTTIDDPLGVGRTTAFGINATGQIVGVYLDPMLVMHGFVRDSGGMYATLDDPSATSGTVALGINGAGQVVGYYTANGVNHGFLYSPNSGTPYTALDDPLATGGTQAFGINDLGQIVGTYDNATGTHAFIYSGGIFTTVDDPVVNSHTFAHGINNSSHIAGTLSDGTGNHGFLEVTVPNPAPPPGTTADLILRGANSSPAVMGQYEIYDIGHNAILAAYSLGQVGTDWAFVTLGGFFGSDTTDMVLRNSSSGAFEDYRISNNAITSATSLGAVGLDWQLGGFAVNPPVAPSGETSGAAQLVQSMAGFGGGSGAAETLIATARSSRVSRAR